MANLRIEIRTSELGEHCSAFQTIQTEAIDTETMDTETMVKLRSLQWRPFSKFEFEIDTRSTRALNWNELASCQS